MVSEMMKYLRVLLFSFGFLIPVLAHATALLPNGKQQFLDSNGDPLANGEVYFYYPGTTTAKPTYQDMNATTVNTNPVVLDAAGRAIIWGEGAYREVVYDSAGALVWDQITEGNIPFGQVSTLTVGTTTDLGTATSHFVELTGTGTINSFGSSADTSDPIYLVKFAGIMTLTYNSSTMILPNDTDLTVAANDSAVMEYLGAGAWNMLGYFQNSSSVTSISLNSKVFTASGTWTVPSTINAASIVKITCVGGGGAGGGISSAIAVAGSAGGAGTGIGWFSGFHGGDVLTVTVGVKGTGGSGVGGDGGNSKVNFSSTDICTGNGSTGGAAGTGPMAGVPSAGANASVVTATGLTLVNSLIIPGSPSEGGGYYFGSTTYEPAHSGNGGASFLGPGAVGVYAAGAGQAAAGIGGGGSGALETSSSSNNGGNGHDGEVIVEWANTN
jgi:hypothetical protein